MKRILALIAITVLQAVPAMALTDAEINDVWHSYAVKLKAAGIACTFDKNELRAMFAEMDASAPKEAPRKQFVADRDNIDSAEETSLDARLPMNHKDKFFADERTNTPPGQGDQVRRKMKALALESLNEVRSPYIPPLEAPRTELFINGRPVSGK